MGIFSVRLVDAHERGVASALVCIKSGFFGLDCGYTDSDGWVSLQANGKKGMIIINHEDIGRVPAIDGATYVFGPKSVGGLIHLVGYGPPPKSA